MASIGTYLINEMDIIPSQSGNGIIALYNKATSGKNIYIKNATIQNMRRDAIGTSTQRLADFDLQLINAQTTGRELTPIKLDSSASGLPSQIKCYTGGNPTYSVTSLTLSSLGNLTFTNNAYPTRDTVARSSGDWLQDGIIPGALVTFSGTTNNNTTYEVYSSTASTLTLISGKDATTEGPVAGSATATIPTVLGNYMLKHQFFATTTNAQFNQFNVGRQDIDMGRLVDFCVNKVGSVESIFLAEGEGVSLKMRQTQDMDAAASCKEFHTYIIECIFTVDFVGGDKTFVVTEYITPDGENGNLFSIINNTGSGEGVKIISISISEAGDISTPYFMLVPFDYIESLGSAETIRDISPIKLDSNNPAISDYVTIKKDVVIYPKGFATGNPLFSLSFGSAVPANGLNYLITKDFLGSVYAAFFPEKSDLTANSGINTVTNNLISQSALHQTMFASDDLCIRPGEGVAIVAAAEPLQSIGAGTAGQVNKFSIGKYSYSIMFTVENPSVTVTLNAKNASTQANIENARVYIIAAAGGPLTEGTVILNGLTDSNGNLSTAYDFTGNQPVIGKVRKSTSSPLYKTSPVSGTITSSGLTLSVFMISDE